jgi:hypothetical protein
MRYRKSPKPVGAGRLQWHGGIGMPSAMPAPHRVAVITSAR